jgi:hypothetical protein
MDQQQPRADWEKAKEFRKGDVAVNVLRLPLRFPRYALEIGAAYVDQGTPKMGRRISVQTDGRGDALVLKSKLEVLTSLVQEAEAWILEQAKVTESQNNSAPKRHNAQEGDRKPRQNGPVLGLKELAKRDKLAFEARKKAEEAAKPAEVSPEV